MERLFSSITVPKLRIKTLIGKNGSTRKKIEEKANVKLFIHTDTSEVDINAEEALSALVAENVIKAIARGFEPKIAFQLFNEDYAFELISLSDFKAKSKNRRTTLKSRIIGSKGSTKRIIENYTECYISVQGKTVSIIGPQNKVLLAKQAIEMILDGANQGTAYRFLERSCA